MDYSFDLGGFKFKVGSKNKQQLFRKNYIFLFQKVINLLANVEYTGLIYSASALTHAPFALQEYIMSSGNQESPGIH